MIDKALPPNIECYDIPETKPNAEPNPFETGESVRLRDGTAANGTVCGILGSEVRVVWEGVPGDPQWYHQDYLLKEKRTAERRAPPREEKPDTKLNPFKIGEPVRLRDGTFTNGTVRGILGNEVRVAWEGVPGDPQWYHQDYLLKEKRPAERRAPPREEKPDTKPNPFKIGEPVRLRDGTFTNGTVKGMLGNEVRVAWDNVPGDPQWYHEDFILAEKRPAELGRAPEENQAENDIVDQAFRLVAAMDDEQRRRFIAHMQETYK
jgi:transcription antitermination factor NusG